MAVVPLGEEEGGEGFGCMHTLEAGSAAAVAAESGWEAASDDKAGGFPSQFRSSYLLPSSEPPPTPSPLDHKDGGRGYACLVPPLPPPPRVAERPILELSRAVVSRSY